MSFIFGPASRAQLQTCDARLVRVLERALAISPVDFRVLVGHRGEHDQHMAFLNGTSKLDWPHGKHNAWPSLAADVAPVPIQWADKEAFIYLAGAIMAAAKLEDVPLRYGGDWNMDGRMLAERFRDLGHVELFEPAIAKTIET